MTDDENPIAREWLELVQAFKAIKSDAARAAILGVIVSIVVAEGEAEHDPGGEQKC